jgi:hypothetical protein
VYPIAVPVMKCVRVRACVCDVSELHSAMQADCFSVCAVWESFGAPYSGVMGGRHAPLDPVVAGGALGQA